MFHPMWACTKMDEFHYLTVIGRFCGVALLSSAVQNRKTLTAHNRQFLPGEPRSAFGTRIAHDKLRI